MNVTVRRADPRCERSAIVEVLVRGLEGWSDDLRYDWLYLENPLGEARCWVLEDDEGGIAGVSAAFPREVWVGGRRFRAWVLGDFCVSERLRSLGPALALQRAAMAAVDGGEVELFYDFPSRAMMAVHARLGVRASGELARFVYPLRVDDAVARRVSSPALARGLSAVGNAVLSSRAALAGRSGGLSVRPPSAASGGDYPAPNDDGVSVRKSARYVSWWYGANPVARPSVLSVADTAASVVYRDAGEVVRILDLLGVRDGKALGALVHAVIDEARRSGAGRVEAAVSEDHLLAEALLQLGFVEREATPFVAYAGPGVLPEAMPWFLMGGDRDLY